MIGYKNPPHSCLSRCCDRKMINYIVELKTPRVIVIITFYNTATTTTAKFNVFSHAIHLVLAYLRSTQYATMIVPLHLIFSKVD